MWQRASELPPFRGWKTPPCLDGPPPLSGHRGCLHLLAAVNMRWKYLFETLISILFLNFNSLSGVPMWDLRLGPSPAVMGAASLPLLPPAVHPGLPLAGVLGQGLPLLAATEGRWTVQTRESLCSTACWGKRCSGRGAESRAPVPAPMQQVWHLRGAAAFPIT